MRPIALFLIKTGKGETKHGTVTFDCTSVPEGIFLYFFHVRTFLRELAAMWRALYHFYCDLKRVHYAAAAASSDRKRASSNF